ncbi:MAG TPA: glycosyltransferase [Candidatus Krumholzibacteria bacterium]|nr:glycosyltransferase [Candidatus Krumholzibacteria bacterium]HRX51677.1 glycosyltransferase [Candidatus Krumholzibacteria bacterium]
MKIVQIGKYYPPVKGGMESVLREQCAGLAAAGCRVTALVAASGPEDRIQALPGGGRLVRCGRVAVLASQPVTPSLLHHLRADASREAPDAVILHGPNPLGAAALLALRRCLPPTCAVAVWHHADVARQRLGRHLVRPVTDALLRRCDGVAVSSAALRDGSRELAPVRAKVSVIPFGVDAARWDPARRRDGGRFLFVGRLVYYKGLDLLLDAVARTPGAQLDVVGDGPLAPRLRTRVRDEGLADRVRLLGERPDRELDALLAGCRALVLPSDHGSETFGVVQLEAMAAGVPVIWTALPTGAAGVGLDGRTGLAVPPADGEALAAALARLHADPELARRLGDAGRRRVREEFSRDAMTRAMLAWLASLRAGRTPA